MKSFWLIFIFQLTLFTAYSQSNPANDLQAQKFRRFYNAGKADSIYAMLAPDVKSETSATGMIAAVKQLKAILGNVAKIEFIKKDISGDNYIADCEKSALILNLYFNSSNKLTAFYTLVDTRERPQAPDLPGTITVKTKDAILKGTLSVPDSANNIPVVLLIAGSGPTDRDGNSLLIDGKPNYFLQISDALKLKNIAVLRYDKRGVGQSTTTQTEHTFDNDVDDASALIAFLKADKRFSKIIVAGHSEGSLIGMLACKRQKADAFISLSGPGFPIDVIMKTQLKENASPIDYKIGALIIDSIKAGQPLRQKLPRGFEMSFGSSVRPYLHAWMQYNPQQEIARLTVPVLIVQGTNDIQVSVTDAQSLQKAKPNAQLKLIKGMSHVLKEGSANKKKNFASYGRSDLPLHPQLAPLLTEFIDSIK